MRFSTNDGGRDQMTFRMDLNLKIVMDTKILVWVSGYLVVDQSETTFNNLDK
jgi:hypothetical protein